MSYTPQELHDFWYGPGGSADDEIIRPGAYVSMREVDVISLQEPSGNGGEWR